MATDRNVEIEWRPFGWSTPQLLLAGLVVVACVLLVVVASTSTAGFSPYNADWDGTGEFRELAESRGELTVATDTEQYEYVDPATTTAVVLAPDREYSSADARVVRDFVEAGGTLVIADNYGSNRNTLLSEVGATARFNGGILYDDQTNYRSAALPIAPDISSHRLVSGVGSLTLNYGTVVEPGSATPIANSSEFSYLLENESTTLDDDTDLQQYPVVTVEPVGEGMVVAIGDPSLFINSMIDETDNRQFASTLVEQRTVTVLDQSHTTSPPPLVAAMLLVRSSPLAAAGVLSVLIGLVSAVGTQYGRRERLTGRQLIDQLQSKLRSNTSQARSATALESGSPRADPEALKTQLRKRHPDWDEERLDRVIAGVLSADTEESDNE